MHVIIVGGGRIGSSLAEGLSQEKHDVVIVDPDPEVCERLSYLNATIIHGDGIELRTLEEAGLEKADVVAGLTPKDETNLMVCLIAKSMKKCKFVARISHPEYEKVFKRLGVDIVIYPELATAEYLQELIVRPDIIDLAFIDRGDAFILEFFPKKGSPAAGKTLEQLDLPKGALVIAVFDSGKLEIPEGKTMIKEGNKVMVISKKEVSEKIRKIFS